MTPNAHRWTAAIDIDATPEQAARAANGQTVLVDSGIKVDCQMVKCANCHGQYVACHDEPCPGRPRRRLRL